VELTVANTVLLAMRLTPTTLQIQCYYSYPYEIIPPSTH